MKNSNFLLLILAILYLLVMCLGLYFDNRIDALEAKHVQINYPKNFRPITPNFQSVQTGEVK